MRERPMTKRFKSVAAALTAAMLAAELMAGTPASATHDPNISGEPIPTEAGRHSYRVRAASEAPAADAIYSTDGGSTWTATVQQYIAGEIDAAQDNGDGPAFGTFQVTTGSSYSDDGGSTWTFGSTGAAQYFAGEHDAAQDNGDGPGRGMFRHRSPGIGLYSIDGGSTWSTGISAHYLWLHGEYDAAQDNGDGPDDGTFRYRSTGPEYSIDGGSTWTATMQQYVAGENDAAQDNGDGPDDGTFRSQDALLMAYACDISQVEGGRIVISRSAYLALRASGESWAERTTLNNPTIRSCPGPRREDEGSNTYTWNVDDGIEPTGDWCVSGRTPADISMICRGEGYTYREARRELRFGLGRP